ncbi:MAG: hypothetical protein L3J38_01325 [Thiomicrorhabdus sp.]|nr:hypothetical protein [Thiomicrorhabdus sp.]
MNLTIKKAMLCGVTSCFLAVSSVQASSVDEREIIWVSAEEKSVLLAEMRSFLEATHTILEGSLADDMEVIEQAARPVGIKMMKATPKALHEKLPAGFTAIGPKAHRGFEGIADEAVGMGDREEILQQLAELQKTCIQCHSMYRLEVK